VELGNYVADFVGSKLQLSTASLRKELALTKLVLEFDFVPHAFGSLRHNIYLYSNYKYGFAVLMVYKSH
jgi:hypothetical protein